MSDYYEDDRICPGCGECLCPDCNGCQCEPEGGFSPARQAPQPGDPSQVALGQLSDGSPLLRIGTAVATGLDFDGPVLPEVPANAIGEVVTPRGLHLIFPPDVNVADLRSLADLGHWDASLADRCWDLRIKEKSSAAPRCLRPVNGALRGGRDAALFSQIAEVWRQGGGIVATGAARAG